MKKTLDLWWPEGPYPGNFGDVLSPLILKKLGYNIRKVERDFSGKFMCIGSTAKYIKKNDIIWGTGIMWDKDPIEKEANYLAVRGPLTGDKVNCSVYGDPALLCSRLWPMQRVNTKPLGFTPHYVDYKKFNVRAYEINLKNKNPIDVIKNIVKCESIISSSLHGIIVAHSYGIPAGWWKPSNKLDGDDSKFKDYAQSVDIQLQPAENYKDVVMTLPKNEKINQIQENLLNAIAGILR